MKPLLFRICSFLVLLLLFSAACSAQTRAPLLPSALPVSPTSPPPTLTPTLRPATPSPSPSATIAPTPSATIPPVTTLLFTGVIVPARCVQAALDANGNPDYPYEEVRELISQADLAIGTFNATMSTLPVHTGCVPTYLLVGSPDNADAMARAGFDLMSVATNHIKNCGVVGCGDQAFFDTLENLRRVGILPVGAGKNLAEALQPVVVTVNGVRFGFVSLGQIEQTTFATDESPGIAVLNKQNLETAIAQARKVSDVVIAMPHWGPEDVPIPNYIQRNLARQIVAAGADLVVGNHTHVVQAVQEIDGVQVFYGLGNFVFDQGLPDHKQGVILEVQFQGTHYLGYKFIPTHVDGDGRVHIAGEKEAAEILARVEKASQALK